MTAPQVRADYDALTQIANRLGREADAARLTLSAIVRAKATLENGDWVGRGATAFYQELNQEVLPSIRRLTEALNSAKVVTQQIVAIMKAAEDGAAALFRLFMASGTIGGDGGGGLISGVGDFFSGAWSELKDMAGGLWQMATDPIGTAQGLWYGVTHPGELWSAFKQPYVEAWESGHPWEAVGRGSLFVGSMLIGTKGLDKAGKAAGVTGKAGELGKTGEVAAAVKTAEAAEAAKLAEMAKAGELSEAAKLGRVAGTGGDDLARIAARDAAAAGKGPYLMPEGFKLGEVKVPAGASPQMIGQQIEAPVRDLVAKHYGFELPTKPPSATGPDIVVPQADRARLGFDVADVKPLNEAGVRKFWSQLDNWRDNGFPGQGPMEGRAALFGYDEAGNVYLYGIFDM